MQKNILSKFLQSVDSRSEIAKWQKMAQEIIIIDIVSLFWLPKTSILPSVQDYDLSHPKNIIIAQKKLIKPSDTMLSLPDFACSVCTLDLLFKAHPEIDVANPFKNGSVKTSAIWIGSSQQVYVNQTPNAPIQFLPVSNVETKNPKKSIAEIVASNKNEDNIKTQVLSPQKINSRQTNLEIPDFSSCTSKTNSLSSKKDSLWKPMEKEVDFAGHHLTNAPKVFDSNGGKNLKPSEKINQKSPSLFRLDFGNYDLHDIYLRNSLGTMYVATHKTTKQKFLGFAINNHYRLSSYYFPKSIRLPEKNVLKVCDTVISKNHSIIFYQYGKLIPLRLFAKEKNFSLEQKLSILKQVIITLQYAHEQKIAHANLSTSKILIDKNGLPKIIGFGIKKRGSNAEIIQIKRDLQKDVRALGYILFELITGKNPLRQDTVHKLQRRSNLQNAVLPLYLKKNMSSSLQRICVKAIDNRSDYRYKSLGEIYEDITTLSEDNQEQKNWSYFRYKMNTYWGQHRDHINVAFIGIFIFLCLWMLPKNASILRFLDPTAKTEQQLLSALIEDLHNDNKAICVLAIKKIAAMGESGKDALPYLKNLLASDEKVISETARRAIMIISPNLEIIEHNQVDEKLVELKDPEKEKTNIIIMLQDFRAEKRLLGLSMLQEQQYFPLDLLELIVINMSHRDIAVSEKAKKIVGKAHITKENYTALTKESSNSNKLVRRVILRKFLSVEDSEITSKDKVVEVFISALDDNDSYNNILAVNFLKNSNLKENKWISEIVTKLRNNNIQIRNDVYHILGKITPIAPEHSEFLVNLLADRNRYVQTYAQQAISQIDVHSPSTTFYLMKAFEGTSAFNQEWFLRGLSEIHLKSENMIPLLQLATTESHSSVRRWAAICIGRMRHQGGTSLLSELESLLEDPNESVKKAAQEAIDKIK